MHATDQPAQQAATPAASDASAAAPAPALKKPATASAPMSIIASDNTSSSPRIKVLAVKNQDAPGSGAIAETPAAQPGRSSQASDQGVAPTPDTAAWPDPGVTSVKTPEPTAAPSNARTESGQPRVDVKASDNGESTADPVTKAAMARSITSWPIAFFPVAALGLVVAGFLLRIVTKISVKRRQRVVVDRQDFGWIDDRHRHEPREDRFVHRPNGLADYLHRSAMPATLDSGISSRGEDERRDNAHDCGAASDITDKIGKRRRRRINTAPRRTDWVGKLVDDLENSLVAASSGYRSGPLPFYLDDSRPNDERRNDDASQCIDEIREREEMLERLRQSLDRLLQSPKVA